MTIEQTSSLSGTDPAAPAPAAQAGADKEMFLKLLVAQIKSQDPLNPADSMQYVTQLAQFTQLEQTIAMRDDIAKIAAAFTPPA